MKNIDKLISAATISDLKRLAAIASTKGYTTIEEKAEKAKVKKLDKASEKSNFEDMDPIDIICSLTKKATGSMAIANAIARGNSVTIHFVDKAYGKHRLHRWSGNFDVTVKGGVIVSNTLVERAWNHNEAKAKKEADNAILFFARQWANNWTTLELSADIF